MVGLVLLLAMYLEAGLDQQWRHVTQNCIVLGLPVVLLLLGLSLLVIPIGHVRRRPAGKSSIVFTIAGSSIAAAVLAFGAALALHEFAAPFLSGTAQSFAGWGPLTLPLSVWLLWVVLFGWMATSVEPLTLADRVARWLLGGTVLELLVAVTCHVIVRRRGGCCAGINTGLGIILGTAIMAIALGPGVFFLFYRRYQQVYRRPRPPEEADG
jgi:hypothetical protein